MPITDQTPVVSYTGNGVTLSFTYNFKIFAETDLKVYVGGILKTLTTDYTVTGVGAGGGGNVIFTSAPTNLYPVVIFRDMPYTRSTDYVDNGDLRAQTLDDDMDRVVMLAQQLKRDVKRAIKVPTEETDDKVISDNPSARANKVLAFDATGAPVVKSATDISAVFTAVDSSLTLSGGNLGVSVPNLLGVAGGTVDAITAAITPAPAALTNNLRVCVEAAGSNGSTTPTFTPNALPAKTIVKGNNIPLLPGDIPGADYRMDLVYDAGLDKWVLLNPFTAYLPKLTTAQKNAITPVNGMFIYETTLSRYQWYNGSWLDVVDTNSVDVLAGKTLTAPKILTGGSIQDGGGDEFLEFVESATPVNHMRLENANTGLGPKFSAQGTDANIDVVVEPKGAGVFKPGRILGIWDATKANNTVYQAATDGFIMGWVSTGGYNGSTFIGNIYSDGSNPPTTVRASAAGIQEGSAGHTVFVIAPIRKGDYYKITLTGSGAVVGSIFWIPLG